jgi:hypothetical protein
MESGLRVERRADFQRELNLRDWEYILRDREIEKYRGIRRVCGQIPAWRSLDRCRCGWQHGLLFNLEATMRTDEFH